MHYETSLAMIVTKKNMSRNNQAVSSQSDKYIPQLM